MHFKVYELARGANQRHDIGVGHPAPARRDHHVADDGELLRQLALLLSEIELPFLREDLSDRPRFAPLDLLVEIEERAAGTLGDGLTHARLSRSGKTDEDQVRLRRISRRGGMRCAKGRRHSSVWFR